ncbi:MAG: hypothetical protein Roseis2KO_54930 [Roseivirga sp.]
MLISCATGKNAFDKGNYETAIDRAVNRLQANPDNKKSKQVLVEGYQLASNYHLDLIRNYRSGGDNFKWERVYQEYQQLNSYYSKIQRCPACLKLVNPTIYQAELENAASLAAQNRYDIGKAALADSTIESGREAFRNFRVALDYDQNLPDIDNLLGLARNMGTVRVLIEPIPVHSRSLALTNEYFENKIVEYLDGYSRDKFVQFFTYDEAEQTDLQPDHIISLQFDDFVLGQTLIESKTKEVSQDSVVVGSYTDSDGVEHDVFGTVKAEVTTNRKTLESNGVMNMEIRDAYTGRILTQQKLPSQDVWVHEWASYNGDERALTKEEIRMSKRNELPPPSPQTLFISFIDRIYAQITQRVGNFYRDSRI